MLKVVLIFAIMIIATIAFGSSEAHHDIHEIPWETIYKQIFNFLLVVLGLTILLKSKVTDYLRGRVDNFEKMAALAKKAKEEAEKNKKELSSRLQKLESTAAQSVQEAKKEADEIKLKIKAEAEELARRIREDAQKATAREVEKAKQELRDEVLTMSMQQTRVYENIGQRTGSKRLQNEFVEKIQVVR